MSSSNVRNIILRALFEPDFHNRLLTDPDKALSEYQLSDKETRALKNPGPEIYQLLAPGADQLSVLPFADNPPTTTVVAVIVVVAIVVFVTAIVADPALQTNVEMYRPLLNAIRSARGPARMDLVKTLVNELTKER